MTRIKPNNQPEALGEPSSAPTPTDVLHTIEGRLDAEMTPLVARGFDRLNRAERSRLLRFYTEYRALCQYREHAVQYWLAGVART
jgi:hypothetical protein